jgi:hypothetical protein
MGEGGLAAASFGLAGRHIPRDQDSFVRENIVPQIVCSHQSIGLRDF